MSRRIYIFVCGILTFPGASRNWTGRAVTWTHINTPDRAEKVEYFVGPISRAFGQKHRAVKLARTLTFYEGWEVVLVGHSNGCDVILDTLRENFWLKIQQLHLISAACEADFETNGLNQLKETIGSVHVYTAGDDAPLLLAGTRIGKLLGYGTLGRTGAVNAQLCKNLHWIDEPEFGHSDWFNDRNFHQTMKRITAV